MEPTSTPLGTLYGLVLTAVGLGLLGLMGLVASWLLARSKESKLVAITFEAFDMARSVVAHLEAEMRPKLTKALADGRLDQQERAELKEAAMKLLLEQLGEVGLKKLQSLRGMELPATVVYLSGLIERALGLQKASAPQSAVVRLRSGDVVARTINP